VGVASLMGKQPDGAVASAAWPAAEVHASCVPTSGTVLWPWCRERERREWEAREQARIAAEAEASARREAHKAAIKELSAQTQVC
jgi:hypothetical protein